MNGNSCKHVTWIRLVKCVCGIREVTRQDCLLSWTVWKHPVSKISEHWGRILRWRISTVTPDGWYIVGYFRHSYKQITPSIAVYILGILLSHQVVKHTVFQILERSRNHIACRWNCTVIVKICRIYQARNLFRYFLICIRFVAQPIFDIGHSSSHGFRWRSCHAAASDWWDAGYGRRHFRQRCDTVDTTGQIIVGFRHIGRVYCVEITANWWHNIGSRTPARSDRHSTCVQVSACIRCRRILCVCACSLFKQHCILIRASRSRMICCQSGSSRYRSCHWIIWILLNIWVFIDVISRIAWNVFRFSQLFVFRSFFTAAQQFCNVLIPEAEKKIFSLAWVRDVNVGWIKYWNYFVLAILRLTSQLTSETLGCWFDPPPDARLVKLASTRNPQHPG